MTDNFPIGMRVKCQDGYWYEKHRDGLWEKDHIGRLLELQKELNDYYYNRIESELWHTPKRNQPYGIPMFIVKPKQA